MFTTFISSYGLGAAGAFASNAGVHSCNILPGLFALYSEAED
jgi:hypothetical protein